MKKQKNWLQPSNKPSGMMIEFLNPRIRVWLSPFIAALMVILCFAVLCFSLPLQTDAFIHSYENASLPPPKPSSPYQRWLQTGMVFPDSDVRHLTKEDIDQLSLSGAARETLLRAAINELYARNGYLFFKSELQQFYGQFSWYAGDCDMKTARSRFNATESENLVFLLSYE